MFLDNFFDAGEAALAANLIMAGKPFKEVALAAGLIRAFCMVGSTSLALMQHAGKLSNATRVHRTSPAYWQLRISTFMTTAKACEK